MVEAVNALYPTRPPYRFARSWFALSRSYVYTGQFTSQHRIDFASMSDEDELRESEVTSEIGPFTVSRTGDSPFCDFYCP